MSWPKLMVMSLSELLRHGQNCYVMVRAVMSWSELLCHDQRCFVIVRGVTPCPELVRHDQRYYVIDIPGIFTISF